MYNRTRARRAQNEVYDLTVTLRPHPAATVLWERAKDLAQNDRRAPVLAHCGHLEPHSEVR